MHLSEYGLGICAVGHTVNRVNTSRVRRPETTKTPIIQAVFAFSDRGGRGPNTTAVGGWRDEKLEPTESGSPFVSPRPHLVNSGHVGPTAAVASPPWTRMVPPFSRPGGTEKADNRAEAIRVAKRRNLIPADRSRGEAMRPAGKCHKTSVSRPSASRRRLCGVGAPGGSDFSKTRCEGFVRLSLELIHRRMPAKDEE